MSSLATGPGAVDAPQPIDLETLASIERRVLWLATRIVDYANRERPSDDPLKVGGHQASSASMTSIMTALWFGALRAEDRVSVKPHASPVLHAIQYLLGRLDRRYLTTLRDLHGLQAYPSRTKDPFPVDYSTGSVGLGCAAPLFGAVADRYVASRFGAATGGSFISLLGDAELDEGSIWEAVLEPQTRGLGNVLWVVDLNRQSLDRVIPHIRATELQRHFESAGWQVLELKYGSQLRAAFAAEGGELLRRRIDEMPNQQYQWLFGASDEVVREALLDRLTPSERRQLELALDVCEAGPSALIQDLGGHDLGDLRAAFATARAEEDRPTVVIAYTIKGSRLPIAGKPANHSALLTAAQIDELRAAAGLTPETEWDGFDADSAEGILCRRTAQQLQRRERVRTSPLHLPGELSSRDPSATSTQSAFGRILLNLSRHGDVANRLVTVSPDVAVSTSLGGWINKVGIYSAQELPDYPETGSALKWRVSQQGHHIELGISEMNLFLLLGQLGLTAETHGEPLFPIGTLYDPFVARGLEGLIYSVYSGARFVVAGTPSGISLSREGGAHQSTITPGIGIETPGIVYAEPCFARELEWLLLDGLERLHEPDGEALYLRLSTKPIDQTPFAEVVEERGVEAVRSDVLAGAFWLRRPTGGRSDAVAIVTCGAMVPEALAAAMTLDEEEGVDAGVLVCSSPDRLYHGWRRALLAPIEDILAPREPSHLEKLFREDTAGLPLVTVLDGSSHALAFVGSALGVRSVPLGVDRFGQTGSQPALYSAYGIGRDAIVTAALLALEP